MFPRHISLMNKIKSSDVTYMYTYKSTLRTCIQEHVKLMLTGLKIAVRQVSFCFVFFPLGKAHLCHVPIPNEGTLFIKVPSLGWAHGTSKVKFI